MCPAHQCQISWVEIQVLQWYGVTMFLNNFQPATWQGGYTDARVSWDTRVHWQDEGWWGDISGTTLPVPFSWEHHYNIHLSTKKCYYTKYIWLASWLLIGPFHLVYKLTIRGDLTLCCKPEGEWYMQKGGIGYTCKCFEPLILLASIFWLSYGDV